MSSASLQILPGPLPVQPAPRPAAAGPAPDEALTATLLRDGFVPPDLLVAAMEASAKEERRLADVLLDQGLISALDLYRIGNRHVNTPVADIFADPPDLRLVDTLGAMACLRDGLLPVRRMGDVTLIATSRPADFAALRPYLEANFGPVAAVIAPMSQIEAWLLSRRGQQLDRAAMHRVNEQESCRGWGRPHHLFWVRAGVLGLLAWIVIAPVSLVLVVSAWTVFTLFLTTLMKAAAIFAALHRTAPDPTGPDGQIMPVISVMVALYKESSIAARLVARLSLLEYPRDCLDVLLVVEEDDRLTRRALERADLPVWMRVVTVPRGAVRTKPRALNHALDICRGTIIGIYDAEDAPEADQLRKVAARFSHRGPDVACLQGRLDYYNPHTNWLSRCFTMEYASWFRILLPGLARLGLPIPLGGTTLFFRRDALEELGAWDAFNVTEDADLGIRLARHGYRTELLDTTTFEEANCRVIPWIKQRSRWLKGYMMTYGVHMRQPVVLWRQLGWWKFLGFQVLFLTTISQYVLAPVMWSFWIVPLGFDHPAITVLPAPMYSALVGLFLFTEAALIAITLMAMRLTPNRMSPLWAPVLHIYFPLGSLASYKAAWELVRRPFWWDKTSHGHFDEAAPAEEAPPRENASPGEGAGMFRQPDKPARAKGDRVVVKNISRMVQRL